MSFLFDLSIRTKLRVTGPDRERFLNGQLTNDMRKVSEGCALHACALNAKGKLNGDLFVTRNNDAFLIDADPDLKDSLLDRLERYVIADDVQLFTVTDQYALFHLLQPGVAASGELKVRSAKRFGQWGHDVWAAAEHHDEILAKFSAQCDFCDADCAEALRIQQGIPRWGRELTDEIIPVEARLDETIDYEKGCYIGQEVISRMKMSGQTNKRLCGLVGLALEPGIKLISAETDGKDAGWITSISDQKELGRRIALGFVRRGFNAPGTKLFAVSATASRPVAAEVVELPFGT